MTTREVEVALAKSQPHATGVGPVQADTEVIPQSLLHKQHNLAAMSNGKTLPSVDATVQDGDPLADRVFNRGAQTPGSLVEQIDTQIRLRAATNERLDNNNNNKATRE
ncbi:hypothetical protein PT974_04427 [Cladobotryum mycophilum]|uniref:SMP domain-containing protein n=1 Tax=Cladobotryum mycophilum TaxID=491253 RepID=A0ABR0SVH9_9HYPO